MSNYERIQAAEQAATVPTDQGEADQAVEQEGGSEKTPGHGTTKTLPEDPFLDEPEERAGLVMMPSTDDSTGNEAVIPMSDQPRINWFDASMHLIKGNLGPGCLNLPHAFALSGWLLGSSLFLIVALQGIYSMALLAELKQTLVDSNFDVRTFMDVAQVSLGSRGHTFVQLFLFVLQAGVCCVFLDLIATNLKAQTNLSDIASIVIVTASLLLIVLVRYMKDLRILSATANVFMITAIFTAAVAAAMQIVADDIQLPRKATDDLGDVATFISSMFFSFEGIGLVLPVENAFSISSNRDEMKEANHLYRTGVLPGAMLTVAVLFWVTGFFGSWGFPDIENGSITAYLSEEFPDNIWFKIVNSIVMVAVFLTFPLQLTPALEVLEEWFSTNNDPQPPTATTGGDSPTGSHESLRREALLNEESRSTWGRFSWVIPRYCIVIGCASVVLVVGDLGLLMALFGAVGQTGLAMMPCLCHLALQRRGILPKHRGKTLMDLLTVVFCTLVMLFGLITSVERIIVRTP